MRTATLINGSYRRDGVTDRTLAVVAAALERAGFEIVEHKLVERELGYCRNCRACTQEEGSARGRCVLQDDAERIFDDIERADVLVLASPVNAGSMTAVMKVLSERMVRYAYWPWGAPGPKFRIPKPVRAAILVSSSAAPAVVARLAFSGIKGLKTMAKVVGARPVLTYRIGLVSKQQEWSPSEKLAARIGREVERLAGGGP